MTLFVVVSEIRGVIFLKFTLKKDSSKNLRQSDYVGRPNNSTNLIREYYVNEVVIARTHSCMVGSSSTVF